MPTSCKFPIEIYCHVFVILPRHTIYQCIIVCRYWYSLALPIYYATLILTGRQVDFWNAKLLLQDQQFAHVQNLISLPFIYTGDMDYRFYLKSYIEPFIDSDEEEYDAEDLEMIAAYEEEQAEENTFASIPKFSSKAFTQLLSYLPNLKKIDLQSNAHFEFYTTILANYGQNKLRKLGEIQINSRCTQVHLAACYKYRRTIRHLVLFYKSYYINDTLLTPAASFLSEFTCLASLKILHFEQEELTLFDVLNACPNLVSLEFESGVVVSNKKAAVSYKRMIDIKSAR